MESSLISETMKYKDIIGGMSENEFVAELERWKFSWKSATEPPETSIDALNQCDAGFYPRIYQLLQIFATLPATSASAERSFSAMRRIKTYLRSTMSEERFCGLAQMNIHRDIEVDPEVIVQTFATSKERRSSFGY